ncbi:TPA: site-specific DNA-methyltransferase [Pseudomonas aeruginosa]|uniref:DNA-methyltransferase n=1 Tax=Pseudomonas aeruginosa TaxID=287 RepID=UPI001CD64582|nr:site-specific DNA-methyltransferase [Pseudomonas aeruginosa]MCR3774939.1 site-specific DNA-methyltransferase [Pseudomonas aeruginosa]MCS7630808.1 site-specific DNA-methyltransferase [Pseudomonas aeruginosa]MCS7911213.1 site-specific DNA-methyltransferase [Pseudomonas aeruginosa]MCS8531460.1 site-specific DNA-methyltransferase [Pseudomonas aeruginosa]MCS9244956.1 site-specific DNA-methyltransferase [Pseudomonas aeruginosa]
MASQSETIDPTLETRRDTKKGVQLSLIPASSDEKAFKSLEDDNMNSMVELNIPKPRADLLHGNSLDLINQYGDGHFSLIVTSPPYFIGKEYDTSRCTKEFLKLHEELLPKLLRTLKPGGSLCWQVGYHVADGALTPLDFLVHQAMSKHEELVLRNRIVWMFRHGANCQKRFSGRHETILWYTKGDDYNFFLDDVRVPQLYPGKRHYKGDKKGEHSGNPLGKNPSDVWEEELKSDVWDIPNVKARHIEKTGHPCQYPTALVGRLVKALCPKDGWVLDPFAGSGSTGVAAILEGRNFVGFDTDEQYLTFAKERIDAALAGNAKVREDKPVRKPQPNEAVSQRPDHFKSSKD